MNAKNLNSLILLAILITVIALIAQRYFPQKSLVLVPNQSTIVYLYSTNLPDGTPAISWLDESKRQWRCVYPDAGDDFFTACSFNIQLFKENERDKGVDLSSYSHMSVVLKYQGSSKDIRVHIRNFDPKYSNVKDENSTKFNAINLQVADLNKELTFKMSEFVVSDWWLRDYKIVRADSQADFHNAVTIGIDFADTLAAGNHDVTIEKIEFTGGWVSRENWYLGILASWLIGLFCFAFTRLVQLHRQTKYDTRIINELNQNNEQLKKESDRFRRLSTVDPLTQTYNRFGIDQIVTTLLAVKKNPRITEERPDFALMIIDIDHFKRVNDNRGHDAGDRILQQVSAIIQQSIGSNDFLGRWGGEEFVVLLPNTRQEFALAVAEKIRITIYDSLFEPDNPLQVSASFGVGERQEDEDFASCFKRVDTALYRAKASGRNCCVMAENSLEPAAIS